ncbi:MAG: hypothetical protein Q4F18_03930 [Clostridia bacterium]|nr:hypothetical protein [Clostridia bacterium]
MYSFQTGAGGRKNRQRIRLLSIIIFILAVALLGVTFVYIQSRGVSESTAEALLARAVSEASEAQSAVYRLTQSSGTNTMTLLANVRAHIYALQCLNTLTANIYGAGTILVDGDLLTACTGTLDQCEARLQAGSVLTDLYTSLRDQVDQVVTAFSLITE